VSEPITFELVRRPSNPSRATLFVRCGGKQCGFALSTEAAVHPVWHWDGNVQRPTITPSIHCQECGRHFNLTNGKAMPA